MLHINPTDMSEKDRYALGFFLDITDEAIFLANDVYAFFLADQETGHTDKQRISLTHHLVKRPCKPHGKHPGEFRYEVVETQKTGSGQSAKIYRSLGTIVPISPENNLAYFKLKLRAAKLFACKKEADKKNIAGEYDLTPPHMHMKPPVFLDKGGFLFMRFINGVTLADILKLIRTDKYFRQFFTAEKCISLCAALAEALNTQVHAYKIVHRDLKPENIMLKIDDATQKWVVTFIDFGLSKKIETNDKGMFFGTPLYVSPESYNGFGTSLLSDVYSLGAICSEILGCDRSKFIITVMDLRNEWFYGKIYLTDIFKDVPGTDKLPKDKIIEFLQTMSFSDIIYRPSAKEAAAKFKTFLKPITEPHPYSFFSSSTAALPANDDSRPQATNPSSQC